MLQLMSHDENVMPDALAGLAASTVLSLSDIPFDGPISEARVARVEGSFIINPSKSQLEVSDIDMMVGASEDSVVMVEGEFDQISEEEMTEAIKFAHEEIIKQIKAQKDLAKQLGISEEKREYTQAIEDTKLEDRFQKIRDWADERGLYDKGDTKTQFCKLMEEAGELGRAEIGRAHV